MDIAARLQAAGQQLHQRRLDQAALVVALFVPGIGEEDVNASQASRRKHVAQHFDGVMLDDTDVGEAALAELLQQRADARGVDLDAEVVVFGMGGSKSRPALRHAEADFKDARCRV